MCQDEIDKSSEYSALKSKELLSSQIESYRIISNKAAAGVGLATLFIPVFLSMFDKMRFTAQIAISVLIFIMIV